MGMTRSQAEALGLDYATIANLTDEGGGYNFGEVLTQVDNRIQPTIDVPSAPVDSDADPSDFLGGLKNAAANRPVIIGGRPYFEIVPGADGNPVSLFGAAVPPAMLPYAETIGGRQFVPTEVWAAFYSGDASGLIGKVGSMLNNPLTPLLFAAGAGAFGSLFGGPVAPAAAAESVSAVPATSLASVPTASIAAPVADFSLASSAAPSIGFAPTADALLTPAITGGASGLAAPAAAAAATEISPLVSAALTGAAQGGGLSALTGQDPLKGAVKGAVTAGVGPVAGGLFDSQLASAIASGAARGVTGAALSGQDIGEGLFTGLMGTVPTAVDVAIESLLSPAALSPEFQLDSGGSFGGVGGTGAGLGLTPTPNALLTDAIAGGASGFPFPRDFAAVGAVPALSAAETLAPGLSLDQALMPPALSAADMDFSLAAGGVGGPGLTMTDRASLGLIPGPNAAEDLAAGLSAPPSAPTLDARFDLLAASDAAGGIGGTGAGLGLKVPEDSPGLLSELQSDAPNSQLGAGISAGDVVGYSMLAKSLYDLYKALHADAPEIVQFEVPERGSDVSEADYQTDLAQSVIEYLDLGISVEDIAAQGFTPGTPEYLNYILRQADEVINRIFGQGADALLAGESVEGQRAALQNLTQQEFQQLLRALYVRGALGRMSSQTKAVDPFTGIEEEFGVPSGRESDVAAWQRGLARILQEIAGQSDFGAARDQFRGLLGRDVDIYGLLAAGDARRAKEQAAAEAERRRRILAETPEVDERGNVLSFEQRLQMWLAMQDNQ